MLLTGGTVWRNVRKGIKWGLIMATVLSTWVAVLVPFNGGLIFRDRSGDGIHALNIVLLYFIGGTVTGFLFGVLLPVLRWRIGAAFLGMLATIPFSFGIQVSTIGFTSWTRIETISLIVMAIAFGGPGGLIIRAFVRDAEKNDKNRNRKHVV